MNEIIIPPGDLITAVIEAVDLVLSALGISPLDELLSLFSGGRPKFEDTEIVIAAYTQSAFWPLHALAAQMAIWLKNGAPISDSNPQVQATFQAAKHGTVITLQALAHQVQGQSGQGYWTFTQLINNSWAASGQGLDSVLHFVRAIDEIVRQLSLHPALPPPPPPKPPPPPPGPQWGDATWPGGPPPIPCYPSAGPDDDELTQGLACLSWNSLTAAFVLWQIYQALIGGPTQTPPEGGGAGQCCDRIVAAILSLSSSEAGAAGKAASQVADAVSKLRDAVSRLAPADLAPLVDALRALNQTVAGFDKCVCDFLARMQAGDASALSLVRQAADHWLALGAMDSSIAQLIGAATPTP